MKKTGCSHQEQLNGLMNKTKHKTSEYNLYKKAYTKDLQVLLGSGGASL